MSSNFKIKKKEKIILATIVIPLGADFSHLEKTLQSIIYDTSKFDVEVIIVGNKSDLKGLEKKNFTSNLKLILHDEVGSVSNNLNIGIANDSSSIIFRMDADDVWNPGRLKIQMANFSDPRIISVGRTISINRKARKIPKIRQSGSSDFIKQQLLLGNYIVHPAVALSKDIFSDHQYRDTPAEDYDLWLRIAQDPSVNFCNVASQVISYTYKKKSVSRIQYDLNSYNLLYDEYFKLANKLQISPLNMPEFALFSLLPLSLNKNYERLRFEVVRDYRNELVESGLFKNNDQILTSHLAGLILSGRCERDLRFFSIVSLGMIVRKFGHAIVRYAYLR